jgi:hypothetical protein
MRPQREDVVRQQAGQGDAQGEKPERDEHIADQSRMTADIEIVHARMPPATPDFFKQKLLLS